MVLIHSKASQNSREVNNYVKRIYYDQPPFQEISPQKKKANQNIFCFLIKLIFTDWRVLTSLTNPPPPPLPPPKLPLDVYRSVAAIGYNNAAKSILNLTPKNKHKIYNPNIKLPCKI